MAEPEDVIAEGALHATRFARELWARRTVGRAKTPPRLADLQRRLDLFIAAVFPGSPEIGVAEPPAPPTVLRKLLRYHTSHLTPNVALAFSDGVRIRLPAQLDSIPASEIPDRYRLLALEQAARLQRDSRSGEPSGDPLLRDLYLLSEAAAIDAMLVGMFPRFAAAVIAARREAAGERPVVRRVSPLELEVERLVVGLLLGDPGLPPAPYIVAESPEASLAWAHAQQKMLIGLSGTYRGMAPVSLWGTTIGSQEAAPAVIGIGDPASAAVGRTRTLPRRPRSRKAIDDEDDAEPGTWMVRADDLQEKAEDPAGLQRPADRDQQADPGELADALSELPEARLVSTAGPVSEILVSEDPIPRVQGEPTGIRSSGLAYPEWDWQAAGYRIPGAIVRECSAKAGSRGWVDAALGRHASLIRAVRRDFERLRPRRLALRRQPDGAELDLDAVVAAYADFRGAGVADDRAYIDTRPVRRDAAIALLVDTSASTDGWVTGDRRIIDVEKEALLIVGEALAALGDPHTILAFGSAGPSRVTVQVLKDFVELDGRGAVRLRIAGLEPDGYTRVGAAVRHATAMLSRQSTRHRLLLLLSDGRPNDIDAYEGRYGIEDTRMAVAEARLQGIHLYCLTVDRQAPRYAARIFGSDYAVINRVASLPRTLTSLLRDLIRT